MYINIVALEVASEVELGEELAIQFQAQTITNISKILKVLKDQEEEILMVVTTSYLR